MRKTAALVAAVALLSTPLPAKPRATPTPKPTPTPLAPHATVVPFDGGERVDLVLDGPLLGWAAPRGGDGRRALTLLVGPKAPESPPAPSCAVTPAAAAAPPRDARLYRWRPSARASLDLVRSGLPEGSLDSADLDGAGTDALLLVRPGEIDAVSLAGAEVPPRTLASDPRIGTVSGDPRVASGEEDAAAYRAPVLGAFATWRRGPGGALRETGEVGLPLEAGPGRRSATVSSPPVEAIGRGRDGRLLWATAPETVGFDRVRTFLLDPDGPEEARRTECWARFPERERLLESAFAILDGAPVLIALSIDADKLSVFGDKRLRIFPLRADRTRAGFPPLLATGTDINLWQAATPFVVDLDGDGRDDVVLAYWKGIRKTIAALEVHRQKADGTFEKGRTLDFDVRDGAPPFLDFGHDLNGDGRPDLVLFAGHDLRVYPGRPAAEAVRRPVATTASAVVPLAEWTGKPSGLAVAFEVSSARFTVGRNPPALGDPRLIDLDGDGRPEVVFVGTASGRAHVSVVLFRGGEAGKTASPPKAAVARTANSTYK